MAFVPLAPHPLTVPTAVRAVEVELGRPSVDTVTFTYVVHGEIPRLRVPERRAAARADGLWRHTCFEAFIAGRGSSYVEYNFSPSTEWAAYSLAGYRDGMTMLESAPQPVITLRSEPERLELSASVRLAEPCATPEGVLRLALAAVIEDETGVLSYWALAHPGARPDFHHPESFTVELDRHGAVRELDARRAR